MLLPAHFWYSCKQHMKMYNYKIHAQSDLALVFSVSFMRWICFWF